MIDILPLFKTIKDSGIPIESVVVGKEEDRSTWRVVYSSKASKEQMTLAQELIDRYDPESIVKEKTLEDRVKALEGEVSLLSSSKEV